LSCDHIEVTLLMQVAKGETEKAKEKVLWPCKKKKKILLVTYPYSRNLDNAS